ncbi:5-oxoprolinase subunit PxpB [Aquimarina sediminis]|uniref:5-oxoprolinase subunit PxpB n=1 Tax=Aquimarina sediminis TaxID=2070536 RepID=UPI000CA030E7|nr:5-oxoprolinase subunit PxpB [Aquimarina sediminis]
MKYELQYKRYAEKAILVEWPSEIDENILQDLLFYKKSIEIFYDKLIVEVISSYNSLLICYVSTIEDVYDKILELKSMYNKDFQHVGLKNRLWKIPVCYTTTLAKDLEVFAKSKSLTIDEIISLHTASLYKVYFIGFLPGFFYLGGLDERLHLPRKLTPSLSVKKGSVAIGGNQTGVYPMDSPGGWHVIGMCPLDLFDPKSENFCFVRPGDKIQFMSISEKEYNDIGSLVFNGDYIPQSALL